MIRKFSFNLFGSVFLVILMMLTFACSDSGQIGIVDGDNDGEIWGDVTEPCTDDADCKDDCMICFTTTGGNFCGFPACEENADCNDAFGADSYCQAGTRCICPGIDGDGDGDDDSDKPDVNTGDQPIMIVTKMHVDFGAVLMGDNQLEEITIENIGGGILQVSDIFFTEESNDDEFSAVSPFPSDTNIISLASGDLYKFTIQYIPINPGKDEGTMRVGSNVGTKVVFLESQEKGVVELLVGCTSDGATITTDPDWQDACFVGLVPLGNSAVLPIQITNVEHSESDNAVLRITAIDIYDPLNPENASNMQYRVDNSTINYQLPEREVWLVPDAEEEFNLIYEPRVRGEHRLIVRIYHNDPRSEVANPYELKVVGHGVVPELHVDPAKIQFGNVARGKCSTLPITLTNRGAAVLPVHTVALQDTTGVMEQVFELDLDPDNDTEANIPTILGVLGIEDSGPHQTNVALTCCPVGNEAYVNILEVISDHLGFERYPMFIPVSCTGVMAACNIYPLHLDFGSVRLDQKVTKTIYITNGGEATARIEDIYIDGSLNFEIDSLIDLPLDISPDDGTVEIDVSYTPTNQGSDTADLIIDFRDGDCGDAVVELNGMGIQPIVSGPDNCVTWVDSQIPPEGLSDEDLVEWHQIQQVTMENSGNDTLTIYELFIPDGFENWFFLDNKDDLGLPTIIPPGGFWNFRVGYTPASYGENFGTVVLCSDSAATSGSSFTCSNPDYEAHEVCLIGNAIDPRMIIEPSLGMIAFTGVIYGDDPPSPQTMYIHNYGNGPVSISDIPFKSTYGSDDIEIVMMDYEGTDITGNFPAEGIQLLKDQKIAVTFKCIASSSQNSGGVLEIEHNDMDILGPSGEIGTHYPIYDFKVDCYVGENAQPVAVVKSPVGMPSGPYGSRTITIAKDACIDIEGASSYDYNNKPDDTPPVYDPITWFEWTADNDVTFTTDTTGAALSFVNACFNKAGEYNVTLRVKDSHDTWSDPNYRDSYITVKVQESPIARAYQCETFLTYLETETGIDICFDGTSSYDPDGSVIVEYRWYVQQIGGDKVNFSTSAVSHYTFTENATYEVTLEVMDTDLNWAEYPALVTVDAYANEGLRIEATWTGSGDVSLHYMRPNGYLGDISDCHEGVISPNWVPQGFGNPHFTQGSSNGIAPEIVVHDNPGNSSTAGNPGPPYRVTARYESPSQNCGYENRCIDYYDDCDRCGCGCLICLGFNCCEDCTKCSNVWVCEDKSAQLIFKIFAGDVVYPSFVVTGSSYLLHHEDDVASFDMQRINGKWYGP